MNLQNLLVQKKKFLKSCSTVVTNTDGRKFVIKGGNSREIESGLPYVVDNKPDMQIAMVAPGIFLSSQDPATSIEILKEFKIKHILSLGVDPGVKYADISYSFIELIDLPESDISETVKTCIQIINNYKKDNILIHCNAGVSRSATIAIAYLMNSEKITYEDAYKKVKSVRNSIKPNEGFVMQLKNMKTNND